MLNRFLGGSHFVPVTKIPWQGCITNTQITGFIISAQAGTQRTMWMLPWKLAFQQISRSVFVFVIVLSWASVCYGTCHNCVVTMTATFLTGMKHLYHTDCSWYFLEQLFEPFIRTSLSVRMWPHTTLPIIRQLWPSPRGQLHTPCVSKCPPRALSPPLSPGWTRQAGQQRRGVDTGDNRARKKSWNSQQTTLYELFSS